MKHGMESYLIKGEGLVIGRLFSLSLLHWVFSRFYKDNPDHCEDLPYSAFQADTSDAIIKPSRLYCRLFKKGEQFDGASLVELGQVMEQQSSSDTQDQDSDIPAGYTYLGQFIDHDITQDRQSRMDAIYTVFPENMRSFRNPALDLDSMYLGGPRMNPELYEADRKTLKIGQTSDIMGLGTFNNDLPRQNKQALIGDSRNDEHLMVSQTQLAFMKFHNSRVAANPNTPFEELRQEVVLHYQSIVLNDFLPRIIDPAVLDNVLQKGRLVYTNQLNDCIPLEFSVAVYRMGHSMVRSAYEWNRIYNSQGALGKASFQQLFAFSAGNGSCHHDRHTTQALPTLPSSWIPDWHYFYDFSSVGGEKHAKINYARKFDTNLSIDLQALPMFQRMNPKLPAPLYSLSTRTLLRGHLVALPTGQQVATALGETPLSSFELIDHLPAGLANKMVERGFDQATPLWYYILREAMVQGNGNRLGAIGSRIVAETFVGLIENSPANVLSECPNLKFSMPEMLMCSPEDINPLGHA